MAEIHLLATAREAKGERPPLHLIDPVEPIPFRPTWLGRLFARRAKEEATSPRSLGISEEANGDVTVMIPTGLIARQEAKLEVWYTQALCDLGPEKIESIISLLEAKVRLGKAILQARGAKE